MLHFARFSQFDGAQFWTVLFFVTRKFIGDHMIGLTVWHKTVHAFFRQFLLISEWHLHIFDFESQETNRTKILQKLWWARLQIGIEVSNGIMNLLHNHRLSFCLYFLKITTKVLLNIHLWLLDLTPVHFNRPDIANARRWHFLVHAVTWRSVCWIDSTLPH